MIVPEFVRLYRPGTDGKTVVSTPGVKRNGRKSQTEGYGPWEGGRVPKMYKTGETDL